MTTDNHSESHTFDAWATYFEANLERHERLDAGIPWASTPVLSGADTVALVHSLQKFELGESGEGKGLLAKARGRNDASYDAALVLFIAEEQKHSALFAGALTRFGAERLTSDWTDGVFVVLRRLMGLRTEVTLFLIAETVAMEYFEALGRSSDPVLRGVARRVLTDEVEHIRFQIDQLRAGFERSSMVTRWVAAAAAWVVALGAATVVAIDHGPALHALGLRRLTFWRRTLRHAARALPQAFRLSGTSAPFGPSAPPSVFFTAAQRANATAD
ncbi:ferritin-like domain-containing protein [Subtercola lobariae]|uniref:Membrane protein n=1 Tax=Subtercola lobariae TaxID=1588641 RepID=A0A917BE62_9MICO|nr:ferritin-like domain-containing protein [Subtercola lobariae]GGF39353.1 membrane protein [Subtercola lobariae]